MDFLFAYIYKFVAMYVIISILPLIYNFIRSKILNRSILPSIKEKWIIVTGATDGIGKAIALNLAKKQHKIIIMGRNQDKLNDVESQIKKSGSTCVSINIDFSRDINFNNMFDLYDVGLLINNVGCCTDGPKYFIDDDRVEDIIKINVLNTYKLTKEVLKSMCHRKLGYIVNIGSITGDFPIPFLSTYSSSKAMIKSWSESLYLELKPFNINVECIDTGYVSTKMSKIRKTNLFCPSPDTYAKSVISSFGSNDVTFSYFPHLLLHFLVVLTPRFFTGRASYNRQYKIKELIERKNKK